MKAKRKISVMILLCCLFLCGCTILEKHIKGGRVLQISECSIEVPKELYEGNLFTKAGSIASDIWGDVKSRINSLTGEENTEEEVVKSEEEALFLENSFLEKNIKILRAGGDCKVSSAFLISFKEPDLEAFLQEIQEYSPVDLSGLTDMIASLPGITDRVQQEENTVTINKAKFIVTKGKKAIIQFAEDIGLERIADRVSNKEGNMISYVGTYVVENETYFFLGLFTCTSEELVENIMSTFKY